MLEEWAPIAFNLVEYRDGVFILAGIDEIQTMLDDQIVKTQVHFQNVRIFPIFYRSVVYMACFQVPKKCVGGYSRLSLQVHVKT